MAASTSRPDPMFVEQWLTVKTVRQERDMKKGRAGLASRSGFAEDPHVADHNLIVEIDTVETFQYVWADLLFDLQTEMTQLNQNWLIVLDAHHSPTLDNNYMGSAELLPHSPPPPPPEAIVKMIFSDTFMLPNVIRAIEEKISSFLGITATFMEMYNIPVQTQENSLSAVVNPKGATRAKGGQKSKANSGTAKKGKKRAKPADNVSPTKRGKKASKE